MFVVLIVAAVVVYLGVAVLVGYRLRAVHRALFQLVRPLPQGVTLSRDTSVLGLNQDLDLVPQGAGAGSWSKQREPEIALSVSDAKQEATHANPLHRAANVFRPVSVSTGALDEEALALLRSRRAVGTLPHCLSIGGDSLRGRNEIIRRREEPSNLPQFGLPGGRMPIVLK
ncbi:MAG: hypothetical protein ACUVWX_07525 [Kiritimatiellia bacterium]